MFDKGVALMGLPIGIVFLSASSGLFQLGGKHSSAAWQYLVWLLFLMFVALLLPSLFAKPKKEETGPASEAPVSPPPAERTAGVEALAATPEPEVEPEVEAEAASPPQPDALTRIEGIGPKISDLLQGAGILTFAQLAEANVDHLRQILDKPRFRLADPETWPEQAKLAAAGDWEGVEALQNALKGGRRAD